LQAEEVTGKGATATTAYVIYPYSNARARRRRNGVRPEHNIHRRLAGAAHPDFKGVEQRIIELGGRTVERRTLVAFAENVPLAGVDLEVRLRLGRACH
jgi:hypothetical protein